MKKIIIKSKKNLILLSKKYNQFYQRLFFKYNLNFNKNL